MESDGENTLIAHLEALRGTLIRIAVATALLYPVGYFLAPHAIELLVRWSCPPDISLGMRFKASWGRLICSSRL